MADAGMAGTEEPEHMDRRQAIKKGVAASAVAGVVWSAPKVMGLSIRPSYAAAASGAIDAVYDHDAMFFSLFGWIQSTTVAEAGGGFVSARPINLLLSAQANDYNVPSCDIFSINIDPVSWTKGTEVLRNANQLRFNLNAAGDTQPNVHVRIKCA